MRVNTEPEVLIYDKRDSVGIYITKWNYLVSLFSSFRKHVKRNIPFTHIMITARTIVDSKPQENHPV